MEALREQDREDAAAAEAKQIATREDKAVEQARDAYKMISKRFNMEGEGKREEEGGEGEVKKLRLESADYERKVIEARREVCMSPGKPASDLKP